MSHLIEPLYLQEFAKSMTGVLDALLIILMENTNEKNDKQIFKTLVETILLITEENSKFSQFVPVLETYINESFSALFAFDKLLGLLIDEVDNVHINSQNVAKFMKCLLYIFKFIVKSWEIFSKEKNEGDYEKFQDSLNRVFKSLERLMHTKSRDLVLAQRFCLKSLVLSIPDLMKVYDETKLALAVVNLNGKLEKGHLDECKITTMKEVVLSPLFDKTKCRDILMPVMTKNISAFMSSGEPELAALVTENLGEILNKINILESKENDVNVLMYACLSPLVLVMSNHFKGKRAVGNANEQTIRNLANMIALLSLMQPDHYKNYVNQFNFGDEATGRLFLKSSLMSMFGVFKNLIEFPVFPLDWHIMTMLQNNVILKVLGQFASTITNSFTNGSDFEAPVWSLFFKCATTFIDQPTLQLETFMENKKLKILDTYGDMRQIMGKELNKMWFNLGENKIHFVPDLVSDVLKIALIDQPDLREATIPIFFDMILCENTKNANFQMFQDEFITKLDHFIGEDDLGKNL